MAWEWIKWPVLVCVVGALVHYLRRCGALRDDAGSELRELIQEFADDIRGRSGRGMDPDWLRYSEESERQHEYTCESLRNFATTALATGIGGTMLMLLVHLLAHAASSATPTEPTEVIQALLTEMGLALIPSICGVGTNLGILILLLPKANLTFDNRRRAFLETLRGFAESNPPHRPDTGLKDTLGARLEEVLRATAHDLPEVIGSFRRSVAGLVGVASTFDGTAARMESATEVLSSSVVQLNALPTSLGGELTSARERWIGDLRENQAGHLGALRRILAEQDSAVRNTVLAIDNAVRETLSTLAEDQAARERDRARWREERAEAERRWRQERTEAEERWREGRAEELGRRDRSLRRLINATTDIVDAVRGLPQSFRNEIREASDSLGRTFGTEARQQVTDLIDAVASGNKEMQENLERQHRHLLNEMGGIVQEGLKPALDELAAVGDNVRDACADLRAAIADFAGHGEGMKLSLSAAAARIDESAAQLADAHRSSRAWLGDAEERYRRMQEEIGDSARESRSLLEESRSVLSAIGEERRGSRGGLLSRILGRGGRQARGG